MTCPYANSPFEPLEACLFADPKHYDCVACPYSTLILDEKDTQTPAVMDDAGFAASELLWRLMKQGLPSSYTYEFHEGRAWFGHDRSYDHRVGTVLPS